MPPRKLLLGSVFIFGTIVGGAGVEIYSKYKSVSFFVPNSTENSPQRWRGMIDGAVANDNTRSNVLIRIIRSIYSSQDHAAYDARKENRPDLLVCTSLKGDLAAPSTFTTDSLTCASRSIQVGYSVLDTPAAALGLPSQDSIRPYDGYLASLNYERRIPNWVLEVIQYNRLKAPKHFEKEITEKENFLVSSREKPIRTPSISMKPLQIEQQATSVARVVQERAEVLGKAERETQSEEGMSTEDMGGTRSQARFFPDPTVPPAFQVHPEAYKDKEGSWFCRGHLAAAQFHKATQKEMNSTFNMNANIIPQELTVNSLDWYRLECLSVKLARLISIGTTERGSSKKAKPFVDDNAKLYVVSGPAFLPRRSSDGSLEMRYRLLGEEKPSYCAVAAPTHLFKVLVSERRESPSEKPQYAAAAFLLPNEPIPEERPLKDYQTSISSLEEYTGLQFFSDMNTAALPDLCSLFSCDVKGSGLFNKRFRSIAQLRSASTVLELQNCYAAILKEHKEKTDDKELDSVITKQYEYRLHALQASAASPLGDA